MHTRLRQVIAGAVASAFFIHGGCAWAQSARTGTLFERLAGSWSGEGRVTINGGADERVRCRADYSPSSDSQLRLSLRCASDSFNLQVSSDLERQGERISGKWTETTYGVSGDLNGNVSRDQISANVDGPGVSARLTLAVRGTAQFVTLMSQGQISSSTAVTLRR